ncbi:MAG: thermonuclease family protein, partial [Salaquimonas sp.]|nr:thermonuclease family protein [Salaquimonas sp.]
MRGGARRLSWRDLLTALVVLVALAAGAAIVARDQHTEFHGRARVSDGDSLEIAGQRLRLVGIDAPEMAQTCRDASGTVECGRSARFHLLGLVAGKRVTCTGTQYDRYDRLLATCLARNAVGPTSEGIELNASMVRDGWAIAYGGYEAEEAEARKARRGMWAFKFERPSDWRRRHGHA